MGEPVAGADGELVVGAEEAFLDGFEGDEQRLGDLAVRHALGGERGDPVLGWRERVAPLSAVRLGRAPEAASSSSARRRSAPAWQRSASAWASRSSSRQGRRAPPRRVCAPRSSSARASSGGAQDGGRLLEQPVTPITGGDESRRAQRDAERARLAKTARERDVLTGQLTRPFVVAEASVRERGRRAPVVIVRAAMAHFHVVSVHPFRDGNGRISRIVQSLMLARGGVLLPEFSSIEEYLGHNTRQYYAVLRKVQAGSYTPERDAGPWVRFCITAHIEQARQRLEQIAKAAAKWATLEHLVEARGWPERLVIALEQSLFDGAERAAYATEADISLATGTSDLRRLLDAGLVTQLGRTRSTRYVASPELRRATTSAMS